MHTSGMHTKPHAHKLDAANKTPKSHPRISLALAKRAAAAGTVWASFPIPTACAPCSSSSDTNVTPFLAPPLLLAIVFPVFLFSGKLHDNRVSNLGLRFTGLLCFWGGFCHHYSWTSFFRDPNSHDRMHTREMHPFFVVCLPGLEKGTQLRACSWKTVSRCLLPFPSSPG